MAGDITPAREAKEWLLKAAKDLRRVGVLLSIEPADLEGALFHCQQAAEKALKGFLTWHDVPFRRVHDLDEISRQCEQIDSSLREVADRADKLTRYAWMFRYPGAPYEPTTEEAQSAAALAQQIFDAILARVPAEAQPD